MSVSRFLLAEISAYINLICNLCHMINDFFGWCCGNAWFNFYAHILFLKLVLDCFVKKMFCRVFMVFLAQNGPLGLTIYIYKIKQIVFVVLVRSFDRLNFKNNNNKAVVKVLLSQVFHFGGTPNLHGWAPAHYS